MPFPQQLHWRSRQASPFHNGSDRPLRATAYLTSTSGSEPANQVLQEFGAGNVIDVYDGSPGAHPGIEFERDETRHRDGLMGATIRDTNRRRSWLVPIGLWRTLCDHFAPSLPARSVELIAAHDGAENDLLLTDDEPLLALRNHERFSALNICELTTGIKTAGVLLRSRRDFTVSAATQFREVEDPILFYRALAINWLPMVFRFNMGMAAAHRVHMGVVHAVIDRATQALVACDALGAEFFQTQDNHVRRRSMYHFDYLMLLCAGCCDAVALLGNRLAGLGLNPNGCSLWRRDFRDAARRRGIANLDDVRTIGILRILTILRNSIHGEPLLPMGLEQPGRPARSAVYTPDASQSAELRRLAMELGVAGDIGLIPPPPPMAMVEPYSTGLWLTREVLRIVDDFAAAVVILGCGAVPPPAVREPGSDRIALLGGI